MTYSLVKKLKLPESPSAHKYVVSLAKGNDKKVWDTMIHGIEMDTQGYKENLDFQIMHLDRTDVVLGRKWLYGLGNTLQRSYLNNSITFEKYGRVFQIQGEHSVLNSPLICSMELERILQPPEEYEVYLCELIDNNVYAQFEKDEIL